MQRYCLKSGRKKEYYGGRLSGEELEALDWEPFQFKLLKADIEQYIDADDDVIDSKRSFALQEEKVEISEQYFSFFLQACRRQ